LELLFWGDSFLSEFLWGVFLGCFVALMSKRSYFIPNFSQKIAKFSGKNTETSNREF
jgi:hypothetical protein